jgi:hypothetical protein
MSDEINDLRNQIDALMSELRDRIPRDHPPSGDGH